MNKKVFERVFKTETMTALGHLPDTTQTQFKKVNILPMFFFGAKNLWCHRWFWKLPGWMGEKDLWDIGILKFQETILVFRWEEILKCWIPKDERRLCLSVLVWDRSADKSGSVSSPPIPPDCPNCHAREEEIEGTRGPHIIFIRHEESWPSKWKEVYPVYIPDHQTL